jgi:hypothetical protein
MYFNLVEFEALNRMFPDALRLFVLKDNPNDAVFALMDGTLYACVKDKLDRTQFRFYSYDRKGALWLYSAGHGNYKGKHSCMQLMLFINMMVNVSHRTGFETSDSPETTVVMPT